MKTTWFGMNSANERDEALEKVGVIIRGRGGEVSSLLGDQDRPPYLVRVEHQEDDETIVLETILTIDPRSAVVDPPPAVPG